MNDDIFKQLEEDFEENLASVNKVDQGGLKTLASLARQIQEEEGNIAKLEETLKEAKKKLLKLTDEDMPAVMQEVGMNKFELDDGSTVEVKPTYGASILVDNRPQAYEWLRENGYDDIIKKKDICRAPELCRYRSGVVRTIKRQPSKHLLRKKVMSQIKKPKFIRRRYALL